MGFEVMTNIHQKMIENTMAVNDTVVDGGNMESIQNNIINQNEDALRNIATKQADIHKDAITTTVRAIKDGFTGDNEPTIYCKHCGATIDADSRYCKTCGKEQ